MLNEHYISTSHCYDRDNVVENNGNYSVQLRNICGLVKVTVTNDGKYSAIKKVMVK